MPCCTLCILKHSYFKWYPIPNFCFKNSDDPQHLSLPLLIMALRSEKQKNNQTNKNKNKTNKLTSYLYFYENPPPRLLLKTNCKRVVIMLSFFGFFLLLTSVLKLIQWLHAKFRKDYMDPWPVKDCGHICTFRPEMISDNWERERNVLFNDALNTFYLRLYGVRHMVKDHSDSEKGNLLPPHGLLLSIDSKGSFICTIPQTG